MNTAKSQHEWAAILNFFSRRNHLRPTRIGVFEGKPGDMKDLWIEDNLPLAGINTDLRDAEQGVLPTVEIMLGGETKDSALMRHVVGNAREIRIIINVSGESLEIEDAENKTTILRFED